MEAAKKNWRLRIEGFDCFGQDDAKVPVETDVVSFSHGMGWEEKNGENLPKLDEIYIVRYMDPASPYFMQNCMKGEILPKVELILQAQKDGDEVFSLRYVLENARITMVRPGGSKSGGEVQPLEEVSFTFERMHIEISDPDGKGYTTLTDAS